MKYFGIKTLEEDYRGSYIHWVADSEHRSWNLFFQYPDRDKNFKSHRAPLEEARRAYESIGYKCVELDVMEVK